MKYSLITYGYTVVGMDDLSCLVGYRWLVSFGWTLSNGNVEEEWSLLLVI